VSTIDNGALWEGLLKKKENGKGKRTGEGLIGNGKIKESRGKTGKGPLKKPRKSQTKLTVSKKTGAGPEKGKCSVNGVLSRKSRVKGALHRKGSKKVRRRGDREVEPGARGEGEKK